MPEERLGFVTQTLLVAIVPHALTALMFRDFRFAPFLKRTHNAVSSVIELARNATIASRTGKELFDPARLTKDRCNCRISRTETISLFEEYNQQSNHAK